MKLKKLLAAVTAAALAVTTMAVTSFTASAATEDMVLATNNTVSSGTFQYKAAEGNTPAKLDGINVDVLNKWGQAMDIGDYSGIEIVYEATDWGNSNFIAVYYNGGTLGYANGSTWNKDNGEKTFVLDFPAASGTIEQVGFQIGAPSLSEGSTDNVDFTGNITVKSVKLLAKPGEGGDEPDPSSYTIAFDSTKELELKVIDASGWGIPAVTKAAQLNVEAIPTGITKGTTTYGELKAATVNLTGVEFKNFSIEGLTADDVSVSLYAKWGSGWAWTSGGQTWNLSTIDNVADDDVLQEMGYQININGDKGGINDMELDAVVKVNSTGGGSEEPEPDTPPTPPTPPTGSSDTSGTYTGSVGEGDTQPKIPVKIVPDSGKTLADIRSVTVTVTFADGSWGGGCLGLNAGGDWKQATWKRGDDGEELTNTIDTPNGVDDGNAEFQVWWFGGSDNGKGSVSYSVTYTYSDGTVGGGGSSSGDTPGGNTPGGTTPPSVSGNSVTMGSTEYDGWYEAVLTKDQLFGSNTGATTITFTGADLSKVGYNSVSAGGYKGIDCTGTVTIQINDIDLSDNFFLHVGGNAATVVTWSFNGGSSGGNEPSNPTDPSNPSAPSYGSTYEPPIPSGATSISMVDTIISTGAASVSFNLGSSAKLDKEVFEALASKGDITVRFNVAGGAYWEIGGANITSAKAVDLGVRMNSTLIPASAVSELAGDKTTIQLSLKHNGDFGFTGVLNVPVGKANNGKFANLYYYHSGKFDFVGSSAISDGRAKFAFSHASNYLIVIDDYAYGEDVSSAAGMTETTETSAVPYVAALVVVSAFAASAVVLKKRLSK